MPNYRGCQILTENGFKVSNSLTRDCRSAFAACIAGKNNKYYWLEQPAEDEMPSWVKARTAAADKDLDLDSMVEFESIKQLKLDFLMKMGRGEVDGYKSYFNKTYA